MVPPPIASEETPTLQLIASKKRSSRSLSKRNAAGSAGAAASGDVLLSYMIVAGAIQSIFHVISIKNV